MHFFDFFIFNPPFNPPKFYPTNIKNNRLPWAHIVHVCAEFQENRLIIAPVIVLLNFVTDRQTDRETDRKNESCSKFDPEHIYTRNLSLRPLYPILENV